MKLKHYIFAFLLIGFLDFGIKTSKIKIYKGIITSLSTYKKDSIEIHLNDTGESKILIIGSSNDSYFRFRGNFKKIDSLKNGFICKDVICIGICRPMPGLFGSFFINMDSISFNLLRGGTLRITSLLNSINESIKISTQSTKVNLNTINIGNKTDIIQVRFSIPDANVNEFAIIKFPHNNKNLNSDICISSGGAEHIVNDINIILKGDSLLVGGFDISHGSFALRHIK